MPTVQQKKPLVKGLWELTLHKYTGVMWRVLSERGSSMVYNLLLIINRREREIYVQMTQDIVKKVKS